MYCCLFFSNTMYIIFIFL